MAKQLHLGSVPVPPQDLIERVLRGEPVQEINVGGQTLYRLFNEQGILSLLVRHWPVIVAGHSNPMYGAVQEVLTDIPGTLFLDSQDWVRYRILIPSADKLEEMLTEVMAKMKELGFRRVGSPAVLCKYQARVYCIVL